METSLKTIYFGGGCFWCTEAVFGSLRGVESVTPGYMGGTVPHPTYEVVSSGTSGHAEVVQVAYHDEIIQLPDLLDIFFATHDPTALNRQGNDIGEQYRSVIFYTSEDQTEPIREAILRAKQNLPEGKEVVTEVKKAADFYRAENYHQHYYNNYKQQPYCKIVIHPKLEKLQKDFSEKLKR